ncbi:MAG: cytochrome b/b6 domain-containing protein [Sandaracinus sp.]
MSTETAPATYSRAQIVLHWAMAAMIVALAPIGWIMSDADPDGALRLWLSRAHWGLGVGLGLLLVARIVVRLRAPKVADVHDTTPPQRIAMRVVHLGLYATIAMLLVSGTATSILGDWPSYLFGATAHAPDLHAIEPREGHELFVFLTIVLSVLHIGGVVLHEVRKGGTLRRMLPGAGVAPKG